MYESPSLHLELAKQRHEIYMTEVRKNQLESQVRAEDEGSDSLRPVRGVFAGILAAVTSVTHRRTPAKQQPGLNPV